jgi:hypothetical protein
MTNQQSDFNPTEWATTKEAAKLTETHAQY